MLLDFDNPISFSKMMVKIQNNKYSAYRESWIHPTYYSGKIEYVLIDKDKTLWNDDIIIKCIYDDNKKLICAYAYTATQEDMVAKDWHIIETKKYGF